MRYVMPAFVESVGMLADNYAFSCPGSALSNIGVRWQVETAISCVLATEAQDAALNTRTISLGQEIDQVKTILGAPPMEVSLGPYVIHI